VSDAAGDDASFDGWLVEPLHPALAREMAARLDDSRRPDRLAWNTFRTLEQWEPDVWIPSLLEAACGPVNPLAVRDWGGAVVDVWGTGPAVLDTVDVVLDGPECVVIVECSLTDDLLTEHLARGVARALDAAVESRRQAGYVLVSPGTSDTLEERFNELVEEPLEGIVRAHPHLDADAVARAIGWLAWRNLGELVLDLAEETDALRGELAHRLVTELQAAFPGTAL
jgi:hypothetical protein